MLLGSVRARRPIALLATSVAVLLTAAIVPAAAAPNDDLAAERARAAALETQIDAGSRQVEILDEQFNTAQASVDAATTRIAEGQLQVAAATVRADTTKQRLASRAAALYMRAGTPQVLPELDSADVHELETRAKYGDAAATRDSRLLDEVRVAQEQLAVERAQLEQQRSAARAKQAQLQSARRDVEAAVAKQQQLLGQVKGDIARRVAEIAAAKQRAEEAQARARMEQAAAAARARDTSTTRSGGSATSYTRGPSGTAPANLPPPSGAAATAVAVATAQLGKPYVYAGAGPDVFDCSGLTMYAWGKAGVSMAHSATLQYTSFPHVPIDQLQPGDLLVFGHPIHHVGMYVGNGTMIEAPHTGAFVRYASIYRRDFVGASRP
jgi:cell wall-associated NlpC family hydrolase